MCVPCILSALVVKMRYQRMRTLFGLLKKKMSGQGAKPLTARQKWTKDNVSFLLAHLCIQAEHSQLGKVQTQCPRWFWRGRMREETMKMPPVSPPARHPVSCPALHRLVPVNHVIGGPPAQEPWVWVED